MRNELLAVLRVVVGKPLFACYEVGLDAFDFFAAGAKFIVFAEEFLHV